MADMKYTYHLNPSRSCRGTTNKTDVQNVPVDTMMDQVKLLILCILKWSWGWYKAMMSSQPHHITSDSVCKTLIYIIILSVKKSLFN